MNQHERIKAEDRSPADADMPVAAAAVTDRVWDTLLAARKTGAARPSPGWTVAESAAWNLYAPLLGRDDRPLVFAQIGQSLDGRVATADGDAADVSGVEGLMHLHRCRALADCVIVGANTAIQDNPRLTVRLVKGDNPARVVIDPRGRLSEDAALLTGEGCLVVQACEQKRPAGVDTIKVASSAEGLDAVSIVAGLIERGFRRIMIEGGGKTIGRFMDADLVDRLHVGISPLIIGAGPSGLTTNPVSLLAQAKRPRARVYGLGSDIIIDCDLKG
ncbi:MAG: RibD family protein [Aliihoeflea sp.]